MDLNELKKEAGDYADKHAFRVPYDGSNKFYDDVDFKASKEGYLAGAKPRGKRIEQLEQENTQLKEANETLATMNNNMWVELEMKRAESQGIVNKLHQLIKAKDLIHNLLRVTWGEGWNYSLDWKVKAEQFISEVEK